LRASSCDRLMMCDTRRWRVLTSVWPTPHSPLPARSASLPFVREAATRRARDSSRSTHAASACLSRSQRGLVGRPAAPVPPVKFNLHVDLTGAEFSRRNGSGPVPSDPIFFDDDRTRRAGSPSTPCPSHPRPTLLARPPLCSAPMRSWATTDPRSGRGERFWSGGVAIRSVEPRTQRNSIPPSSVLRYGGEHMPFQPGFVQNSIPGEQRVLRGIRATSARTRRPA